MPRSNHFANGNSIRRVNIAGFKNAIATTSTTLANAVRVACLRPKWYAEKSVGRKKKTRAIRWDATRKFSIAAISTRHNSSQSSGLILRTLPPGGRGTGTLVTQAYQSHYF